MEHTTIAVDLAKSVFQVAVSHRAGRIDTEKRLARDRFLPYLAQQPPATVLLEACGSSHHWARQLAQFGHVVRLLPAHDVHRYVRRNKTDRADAKALLEAARNDEIHPVPIKTIEQQAITSLHCVRSTWLATRTARLNTLRGLLREFGIFIPVGAQHVVPQVRALLGEPTTVPVLMRSTAPSLRTTEKRFDNAALPPCKPHGAQRARSIADSTLPADSKRTSCDTPSPPRNLPAPPESWRSLR